ncbi:MAG: hypothetical protein NTW16_00685 [Bacteroidetes bacterium]|nr:hypothetical protein [Bacteroidota bacterium]
MNIEYKAPVLAENDDLLTQLKEATEKKAETFSPSDFAKSESSPADHIGPAAKTDFIADLKPIQEAQQEPEPLPIINYKEQARLLIAFVDGFQTLALPVAYQKSYFTDQETEALKNLKKLTEAPGETVLSESDQELYEKYNDCQDLIDKLPFTDREVKMLENPMAAVMEKYKFTPGPETLLMGALFTVMAPRLAPLLVTLR